MMDTSGEHFRDEDANTADYDAGSRTSSKDSMSPNQETSSASPAEEITLPIHLDALAADEAKASATSKLGGDAGPSSSPPVLTMDLTLPALSFFLVFGYTYWTETSTLVGSWIAASIVGYGVEQLRVAVRQETATLKEDETILGVILYTIPLVVLMHVYKTLSAFLFSPLTFSLKAAMGFRIRQAPNYVPAERRKQTVAVIGFMSLIPLTVAVWLSAIGIMAAPVLAVQYRDAQTLVFWTLFLTCSVPMGAYLIWATFVDDAPRTGARAPFLRTHAFGRNFCAYFPITLDRHSPPLDPSRKYVFAYHPHGIIGLGAFGCFATEGAGFSELFQGIDIRLLTLDPNLRVPFLREFLLSSGVCSCAKEACKGILSRGPGSAICLVVGGAAEALETEKGTYRLILNRKGFVRVALESGADLIPVLGFGETSAFETLVTTRDSKIRKVQQWLQRQLGFSMPIFWGRGIFQYDFGFLPRRRPVNVVTGPPVSAEKFIQAGFTGEELVNKVHEAYIAALKELYEVTKNTTRAGLMRRESLQIIG